jgi:hypothetical protein
MKCFPTEWIQVDIKILTIAHLLRRVELDRVVDAALEAGERLGDEICRATLQKRYLLTLRGRRISTSEAAAIPGQSRADDEVPAAIQPAVGAEGPGVTGG